MLVASFAETGTGRSSGLPVPISSPTPHAHEAHHVGRVRLGGGVPTSRCSRDMPPPPDGVRIDPVGVRAADYAPIANISSRSCRE